MSSDRPLALALALTLALAGASPALAGAGAADPRKEAQEHFDRGLALLDAGDLERALAHFQRSRELVPSKGNTTNAAHCLHELGRYDEALELYEELVARFAAELGPDNRAMLVPAMKDVLAHVGKLAVTSNVGGTLVVDGRARGKLPAHGSVPLTRGHHVVRVIQDGYATFERAVDVATGQSVVLDAVLEPLASSGRLRVEDPANAGAKVFVDGVEVGVVPWEGTLGPGAHVIWTRADDRGSAPSRAVVVQGQTVTTCVVSAPLGPPVTIAAEPGTATLRLDGVELGAGSWTGPLPVGSHELLAMDEGYRAGRVVFVEPGPGGAPLGRVVVALDVDATHPRWPRAPERGNVVVDAFVGLGAGPGLGGDAAAWCPGGCGRGATGAFAGARIGWRFPVGVSLELVGAYVGLASGFDRTRSTSFRSSGATVPLTYSLHDEVRVRAGLVAAALAYRARLGGTLGVVTRLAAGGLVAATTDPIEGTAATPSGSTPLVVASRSQSLRSIAAFLEPEVGVEARFGALRVGGGVGLGVVLGAGPAFDHDLVEVSTTGCTRATPSSPACAPASSLVAGERAYRSFVFAMPTLTAGYDF